MNPLTQFRTTILPLLIGGMLACPGVLEKTEAVVPAPDGGYPGGNTAEGSNALFSLTTGTYNTAVGFLSLRSNAQGNSNTAVGAGALLLNTADNNTATGTGSLLSNTIGVQNTAHGAFALFHNTEGDTNTASGTYALTHNTVGDGNTATGAGALESNTEGDNNTAIGGFTLAVNTVGGANTATGFGSLFFNRGHHNTAMGFQALFGNTDGYGNTAIGREALSVNTIGYENTAIGDRALSQNTEGTGNIALGVFAGLGVSTAFEVICIGASGANVSQSCYIGNIWGQLGGSQAVYVNSEGKLGGQTSSRRFKEEIKPMARASEVIYGLQPVTFRYKQEIESTRPIGFGLIAEEVEKINPDLVTRDKEGKPLSVRYDQVNAMLLNEFLKEHRKVTEQDRKIWKQETIIAQLTSTVAKQGATVAHQQEQIDALNAGLQKVSAQIETSKVVQNVARNNP